MATITNLAIELADAGDGWSGHMDGWGGAWMWLWGSLMMLVWIAVIVGAVVFLLRSRDRAGSSNRARELLDERYARGELTTEEYRERVDQLR